MKGRHSITINGRLYDAVTGMPIEARSQPVPAVQTPKAPPRSPLKPAVSPPKPPQRAFSDIGPVKATPFKKAVSSPRQQTPSRAVHTQTQKSQTLYRGALKRPPAQRHQRSAAIQKFAAPQPSEISAHKPLSPVTKKFSTTAPQPASQHPAVVKALATMQSAKAPLKPAEARSSKELKELLIKERLAEVSPKGQKLKQGFFKRKPRLTTILTSTLAALLLGGYLTYVNLPNISMRVAATRAGVAANFPSYKPDSFSFRGPITYSPGEVSINFSSNTNDSSFTLKQRNSSWDSQAVLDSYVAEQTDKSPLTYHEKGLTIYAFDNQAAWVNGGLLYTIEGNAQLSSEQLLRLATSM